jgi:hypothetical protein
MPQVVEVPGFGDVEFPDDMTDDQIASAIQKNMAPKAPAVPTIGGTGGFNPILSMFVNAEKSASNKAGVTDEMREKPFNPAGMLEVPIQAATGLAGTIGGGLWGLGQGAKNLFSPGTPAADRVAQAQEALTYKPRTAEGNIASRVVGAPGEIWQAGTNKAGEVVTDVTGSPALGAAVKTVGDLAPAAIGARGLKRGPKEPVRNEGYSPPKDVIPTTEQLGKSATEAYKRAEDAGISISSESFEGMKARLVDMLGKDGIDPDLHPNATAALKRVTSESGPVSLEKLETLRRIALDAEDTLVKADAKKAGDIVDAIDEYVDNLPDAELTSGRAKDAAALKEARALYTRKRKSEDIERLIKRAEYAPSGFENGLVIEFRSLAKNDRRFKRFNADEQAAIDRVAKGGPAEKALRLLGKAAPTGIVSGGLSSGAGFAFGGPVGAVALPIAGIAGRVGAKYLTTRNARQAAELMRRGPSVNPLSTDIPMLPIELAQALVGKTGARSPATIRADIDKLVQRAGSRGGAPGSSSVREVWLELERLQAELASAEARGSARGVPSPPQGQ